MWVHLHSLLPPQVQSVQQEPMLVFRLLAAAKRRELRLRERMRPIKQTMKYNLGGYSIFRI